MPSADKVILYLEVVIKGAAKKPARVRVRKDENPYTRVVVYTFRVAEEDRSFFRKLNVRKGLLLMTDRAAYKFYPRYRNNRWHINVKQSSP